MVDLYVKPSISGFNSSPPPDDNSQTAANAVSWAKHINKIGTPLNNFAGTINDRVDELADKIPINSVTEHSTNHTLTTSDYGKLLVTTNAITITLLAGATAGSNFVFYVFNNDASNVLTLDRNGANINGAAADATITPGGFGIVASDGTDWWVLGINSVTLAGTQTIPGAKTHTGTVTMSGKPIELAEGAAVASAATTDIWTNDDGNALHVTGSTGPITSLGTAPQEGAWRFLIFDSTPTLTQSANLNLNNGGSDITAEAGDLAFVYADTTTQMDVFFLRKTGYPVNLTNMALVTPTMTDPTINDGVANDGGGFKHKRVSTGAINGGGTVEAAVTVTWDTAFADANYTVTAGILREEADATDLRILGYDSVTAASVIIRVRNEDAASPRTGTLHVIAVHD